MPPSAPQKPAPADGPGLRGLAMQLSLATLLDRVRGAREVLPHLAALERALGRQGARAIDRIPPQHLAKICSQLSSLPLPQRDPPLHELLSRLLDALEAAQPPLPVPQFLSTFISDSRLTVDEASHSDFEDAILGVRTTTPMPR